MAARKDLGLPAREIKILREIAAAVVQRKSARVQGLVALFVGSGVRNQVRAAEVIAQESGRELHRIAAGRYIGETEKNLGIIFRAATANQTVLFFDETDALFSTRSDVKESHDRYANIEASYFWKQIEDYPGLAILAFKTRKHIDASFLRRLRFVVTFPPRGTQRVADK